MKVVAAALGQECAPEVLGKLRAARNNAELSAADAQVTVSNLEAPTHHVLERR
jgi:hypothetical protein